MECPVCEGTGRSHIFRCSICEGSGTIKDLAATVKRIAKEQALDKAMRRNAASTGSDGDDSG